MIFRRVLLSASITALALAQTQAQAAGLTTVPAAMVGGLAPSATIDATNGGNITSGTLPPARLPAVTGDVTATAGGGPHVIAPGAVTAPKISAALSPVRTSIATTTFPANLNSFVAPGYSASGDAGAGCPYVRGASTGPGAIQDATGAWWQFPGGKPIDVTCLGVKADGVTDDTAALRTAFAIPNAILTGPAASISVNPTSGAITSATNTGFVGVGRGNTIFAVQSANLPVFTLANYHNFMKQFSVQAGQAQTSGSVYVTVSGPESFIEDFDMSSDYTGVLLTGSVSKALNGRFSSPSSGAIRIRVEGGDNSSVIDGVLMGAETSRTTAAAGIRVRNSSALTISNTSVISEGTCLLVDPTTGTTSGSDTSAGSVFSLTVHDSFFDTCATGVQLHPTGTASVVRSRFTNVWTSSATGNGIAADNGGSGSLKGLTLVNHHSMFSGGSGLETSGSVSDVQVFGGEWGGNAYGAFLGSGLNNFTAIGAAWGQSADAGANSSGGIALQSGITNYLIEGNSFLGQSTPISNSSPTGGSIKNNTGYNPVNAGASYTPASSGSVYTAGASPEVFYFYSGSGVVIYKNGVAIANATPATVQLEPGQSFTLSYSSVPTVVRQIN